MGFSPIIWDFSNFWKKHRRAPHSLEKSAKNPALESSRIRKICPNPEFQAVSKFAEVVSWSICCSQWGPSKDAGFGWTGVMKFPFFWGTACKSIVFLPDFPDMVLRCPLLKTSELAGHFFWGEPHAALGLGVQAVKKSSEKWLNGPVSEDTGHESWAKRYKVWKKNKSMRILPFNKPYEAMNHSHPKNGQNSTKKDTLQFFVPIFGMVFKGCWWSPTRPRGIKGSRIESPGQLVGPRA